MSPADLLAASKLMQELKVGPKEAAILASIGALEGKGQAATIGDMAGTRNRGTLSAQLGVLQRKRLIEQAPNPIGWPFYRLTSKATKHLTTTNQ